MNRFTLTSGSGSTGGGSNIGRRKAPAAAFCEGGKSLGRRIIWGRVLVLLAAARTASSVRPRREPLHLCFRHLLQNAVSRAFGVDSIGSEDQQYRVA